MFNKLSLQERQEQVHDLLRPDEIRRHRVAEGLNLTTKQALDLEEKARVAATFAERMSSLSNAALTLDALDPESRRARALLGTEPMFQARKRGEVDPTNLPSAEITKIDLVMTDQGFSIVEIEPGKVRGLGYGRMVREQASSTIGHGSDQAISDLTNEEASMIALSDNDRFHIPELSILGKFSDNLSIISQSNIKDNIDLNSILASPLKGRDGKAIEAALRQESHIISDRRLDLESKGALAMVHNANQDDALEGRLEQFFDGGELEAIRKSSPKTFHTRLMTRSQRDEMKSNTEKGLIELFAKPMSDAGTRGMLTPDKITELSQLLSNKQANSFVLQEAVAIKPQSMESIDVISGEKGQASMNIRVTLHIDRLGNIIEASVVGSPDDHLAHGGKDSVITNVEVEE